MTPLYGFDGAAPFDLNAAKRAGAVVVSVYIVGTPGGFFHADATRVAQIRALGMGALPNWERQANFFDTCSLAQAQAAGAEAATAATALGFPADGTVGIPFSYDFDVPAARFAEMGQKAQAVARGLAGKFKFMGYLQQSLLDWLVTNGYITGKHWLMMSTFGQPYDPASGIVCMVQGHDITGHWTNDPVHNPLYPAADINTVTDPYGLPAWWPPGSPYAANAPKGPLVALTDAQQTELYNVAHFLGAAFEVGGTTGLRTTGEFGEALREIRDNFGHIATDTDLTPLQTQLATMQADIAALKAGGGQVDPVALAKQTAVELAAIFQKGATA